MNKSLIKNISQSYVMAKYLSDLCQQVGKDNYLNSYIRLEHGTGVGFFGISNTGSTDCIKERFRGITDSLDLTYKKWKSVKFVSKSCIGLTNPDFKKVHRIEHTHDISNLYLEFEEKFIISGASFTPAELGIWVISNQVVCLILQQEQQSKHYFNSQYPFSKYSNKIFDSNGTDISDYTVSQIQNINLAQYAKEIAYLQSTNFNSELRKQHVNLIEATKKHTLPDMSLAVQYHNDEYELLSNYYNYKASKRCDKSSRWYNESDAHRYNVFLTTGVKL